MDADLFSERVAVERKFFSLELRENPRGRFLKITEDVGGRKDAIIIPAPGLHDVLAALERAVKANDKATS